MNLKDGEVRVSQGKDGQINECASDRKVHSLMEEEEEEEHRNK